MKTAPLFLLFAVLLTCCTSTKPKTPLVGNAFALMDVTVTQQDIYPGAQGPMRMMQNFKASFLLDNETDITLVALLVDSVQLPITRLKLNGQSTNDLRIPAGTQLPVEFSATRRFPSDMEDAPPGFGNGALILEEDGIASSGKILNGAAEVRVKVRGVNMDFPLATVTELEEIFAP